MSLLYFVPMGLILAFVLFNYILEVRGSNLGKLMVKIRGCPGCESLRNRSKFWYLGMTTVSLLPVINWLITIMIFAFFMQGLFEAASYRFRLRDPLVKVKR